ncbi:MAG: DUF4388 domain-containing protein, partial [Chitinivibrionales bacterium]|nr:DUF4388 domain-containing protein [Chitinivibrionales bacterium]
MLKVDKDGTVTFSSPKLKSFFQKHAGSWRVVSSIPGLLLFQRKAGPAGTGAVPLMAGETKRRGWIVDLVSFIASSRLTGELIILSSGVQRELFFEHGALRMAGSSAKCDLLGEFMVSQGVLTREQLKKALSIHSADKRLGQLLVELGFISGPDVYKVLNSKLTKIFVDAVSVESGAYFFLADIDMTKLPTSMYMDTQAMLLESVRRIDDQDFYTQSVPRVRPGVRAAADLSEPERRLLAAADGAGTLAALDQQLNMGMEQVVAAAHELQNRGLVEILSKTDLQEQAVRSIVDAYNDALVQVYEAIGDKAKVSELVRQTTDFITGPTHGNQTLARFTLGA